MRAAIPWRLSADGQHGLVAAQHHDAQAIGDHGFKFIETAAIVVNAVPHLLGQRGKNVIDLGDRDIAATGHGWGLRLLRCVSALLALALPPGFALVRVLALPGISGQRCGRKTQRSCQQYSSIHDKASPWTRSVGGVQGPA